MFGIGETELVIIVVFAFLLFGPDKLPGMGRTLGRVLRQFREASDGFTEVVQTNIMDPASEELEKSPKQRKREAAADLANDADAQAAAPEEAPIPRRETFAERKARLKAEREAAAAAASEAGNDAAAQDESAAADAAVVGPRVEKDPSPQDEEAAHTSAADLYALTSQKSSRSKAKEAASQAQETEGDRMSSAPQEEEATNASEEEDGSTQA